MATIIICSVMIAAIVGVYIGCVHQADTECGRVFRKERTKNHI